MSKRMRSFHLTGLVVFGLLAGGAQADVRTAPPASMQALLQTLNERLDIADQVALTKWDSGKPIQDSVREAQVIESVRKMAAATQVDPDEAAELFAAQIEGNKLVQYGLLAQWQSAGKAPDTPRPNLVTAIRPQLDELQVRLLAQFGAFTPMRKDPNCRPWLETLRSRLSKDPLHRLALIRATGELCTSDASHVAS